MSGVIGHCFPPHNITELWQDLIQCPQSTVWLQLGWSMKSRAGLRFGLWAEMFSLNFPSHFTCRLVAGNRILIWWRMEDRGWRTLQSTLRWAILWLHTITPDCRQDIKHVRCWWITGDGGWLKLILIDNVYKENPNNIWCARAQSTKSDLLVRYVSSFNL